MKVNIFRTVLVMSFIKCIISINLEHHDLGIKKNTAESRLCQILEIMFVCTVQ